MSSSTLRVLLLALLVLAAGSLAAGCGDSESGSDGGSDDTAAEERDSEDTDDGADDEAAGDEEPASDEVEVVPGESIGGVAIDDTREDVEALLGKPDSEDTAASEMTGLEQTTLVYGVPDLRIILTPEDTVQQVETTDDSAVTAEGIGIASTLPQLEEAYPDADCAEGDISICTLGVPAPGEVTTDFFVAETVNRIVVARLVE